MRARRGDPQVPQRAQPSIAVSADGERWSVINASPDLRDQFARFEGLHPKPGTRAVPLDTLVLTSAELDHALGALVLREALSYRIVTSGWVHDAILRHNAAFRLLEPAWGAVALDRPFFLDRDEHLEARLFPVPGKVPGYLRDLEKNHKETYRALQASGELVAHVKMVGKAAMDHYRIIEAQMSAAKNLPEDYQERVDHLESIPLVAEEIVLAEVVFNPAP